MAFLSSVWQGLFEDVVKHCGEADTCAEKLGLDCFSPVACVVVAEFGSDRGSVIDFLANLEGLFGP